MCGNMWIQQKKDPTASSPQSLQETHRPELPSYRAKLPRLTRPGLTRPGSRDPAHEGRGRGRKIRANWNPTRSRSDLAVRVARSGRTTEDRVNDAFQRMPRVLPRTSKPGVSTSQGAPGIGFKGSRLQILTRAC
eukprot:321741-Prorocentrum_minimum.AAC.4